MSRQTIAVIITCVLVVGAVLGAIAYFDQRYSSDNLDAGEVLSFGQVLVDILLLPTVIVGFAITAQEFRKAQEAPELDLYWKADAGQEPKSLKLARQGEHNTPLLMLKNAGNAVAVWYVVHFDIPLELLGDVDHNLDEIYQISAHGERMWLGAPGARWGRRVGGNDNWQVNTLTETVHVAFMGNGSVASFPGAPMPLGMLNLPVMGKREVGKEYQLPFKIFSDRGKPKNGKLTIMFG